MPAAIVGVLLHVVATYAVNVLVVYTFDASGQNQQLATALASGVHDAGTDNSVRLLAASAANFRRDVAWADVIALGSGVDNGSVMPELLQFIDSFDIMDSSLSHKVGGAFATGGGAAAGLQPVLEQINRALLTLSLIHI